MPIDHDRRPAIAADLLPAGAFDARIELRLNATGLLARRAIAGSNLQWVDGGDNLIAGWFEGGSGPTAEGGVRLSPGLAGFAPSLLASIEATAPGALRFPGGTHSDVYRWRSGVGPLSQRGMGEHVFRRSEQRMLFGTAEFLALASRVQAEPIITLNIPTGTPQEAADWVKAVNVDGLASVGSDAQATGLDAPRGTPMRVRYWELGNEPYLEEQLRPDLTMTPDAFATKANAVGQAVLAIDPTVSLGLPLRLDRLGAFPQVRFPGYAERVLRDVRVPLGFVALHNGYLPLSVDGIPGGSRPDDAALYSALMAASRVIDEDLAAVRLAWSRARPGSPLNIAVTEYSALFSIGGAIDHYINSLGAALYTADVLRVLASAPDVIMANHWSMTGNWHFGALDVTGTDRTTALVLRAYRQALRGRIVPLTVASPGFSSPAIGVVPSYDSTALVAAFATHERGNTASETTLSTFSRGPFSGPGAGPGRGGRVRMVVINKDPQRAAYLSVRLVTGTLRRRAPGTLPTSEVAGLRAYALTGEAGRSAFQIQPTRWRPIAIESFVTAEDDRARLLLPAASVGVIEVDMR